MSESERTTEVMTAPPESPGPGWRAWTWLGLFVLGAIAYAGGEGSATWNLMVGILALIGFILIFAFVLWLLLWIIRWSVRR